jgi:hypothetical protein
MENAMKNLSVYCALFGAISQIAAAAPATIPNGTRFTFAALENTVATDVDVASARSIIAAAIPVGLPTREAEDRLERAGARCGQDRHGAARIQCRYEAPLVSDADTAAAITWTTSLVEDQQRISAISVAREIERR